MKACPLIPNESNHFEHLELKPKTLRPSIEEPPDIELKPLPEHLRYVFLSQSLTLLVIIALVIELQEEKLL